MLNLFSRHLDVPFQRDASNAFIPWIIGMMVFLATLSLVSANSVSAMIRGWDTTHKNTLVIEILPGTHTRSHQQRKEDVVTFLRQSPLVRTFQEVTSTDLGSSASEMPFLESLLPTLIDVEMVTGARHKMAPFTEHLEQAFQGVQIQDASQWAQGAVAVGETVVVVSLIVATLVALAAIATIAFVTQTGLKAHDRIIDILQLVGAQDAYVAGQFQTHALTLGIKGALIGMVLSIITFSGLSMLVSGVQIPHFGQNFSYMQTVLIALLTPLVGVFLMSFSARLTVLSALGRRF